MYQTSSLAINSSPSARSISWCFGLDHIKNSTLLGGKSRRPKIIVKSEIRKSILPWTIDFETAIEKEQIIAGSAESVFHYLEKCKSKSGCNFLLLSFWWGDLNHEEATNPMKIVGDESIE
jgi:hypothetical protein